jgi:hypothetical protein
MHNIYDDINSILQRAFPQGTALLRHEHGSAILHLGARELVSNAQLAYEVLGPRGAKALGKALLAVGQQHVAVAERMLELAAGGESTPEKPHCGRYNTEQAR